MHQYLKFILFGVTLYSLSVHHQEFKTYIQQQANVKKILLSACSDTAVCLLASRQQYLFDICLLLYVSLELLMMDGKTVRNM